MYDDHGRPTRAVTRREPEWDDEQRAVMVALAIYQANVCTGCGGWLPETTDPGNEDRYRGDLPIRCHKCTAINRMQKVYVEQSEHPGALRFGAHLHDET